MCSSRSRCALAGVFLLAAAIVFASPAQVNAQSSFDQGVVAAIDQVVNLIAQTANTGRHRADLGQLQSALDQLLNVLEQPRHSQGDKGRRDEHRGHLRHGLASAGHDRHHDEKARNQNEGQSATTKQTTAQANRGQSQNPIGAMPGQPTQTVSAKARTTPNVSTAGQTKQGNGAVAGASQARPVRTLAPAGQNAVQQANAPGAAKQGAGPANLQAKNGGARKSGTANQANGGTANNQANPNMPGVAKDGHHHHHHHHFGEARDAGHNGLGQGRQGQSNGNFGNSKNGTGPQANQVRAKTGSGANSGGNVANNSSNSGNKRTTTNTNATQMYVNQMMNANGARQTQHNQMPTANNAQRPQGNMARQPATNQNSSMARSFHGFSNSPHVHAGNSVGQRGANHSTHSGKK